MVGDTLECEGETKALITIESLEDSLLSSIGLMKRETSPKQERKGKPNINLNIKLSLKLINTRKHVVGGLN
jgi:hypothetical protein